MIKVIVSGFSTNEEAKVFCDWYEGQGEQDASCWFDENCPELDPCSLTCKIEEVLQMIYIDTIHNPISDETEIKVEITTLDSDGYEVCTSDFINKSMLLEVLGMKDE